MLTKNLRLDLLELVATKFAKIDHVPEGYFYPELYGMQSRAAEKK